MFNNNFYVFEFIEALTFCIFKACCVWMFNVLNECYSLTTVNQKLARIQTAYVALLAEKNSKYDFFINKIVSI